MKTKVQALMRKESFFPGWLGVFINPFYFARLGLANAMKRYSKLLNGKLLDVGCGTKPYRSLFVVDEYVGLDIASESSRKLGIADYFYDGKIFPFPAQEFDAVLCNQVLEHIFNPNEFLGEISRVMKPGAKMVLTVPFIWDEHEQPYDYARYSSFGLKALLEGNGFKVLKQEKLGADVSILFQLTNAYLYKISEQWNKYIRLIFTLSVMGLVNLTGLVARYIFPKNPDLFLDHVVLVEKAT
jgi:SAM-dependent methyltransferase